jgi:hypothetical protein
MDPHFDPPACIAVRPVFREIPGGPAVSPRTARRLCETAALATAAAFALPVGELLAPSRRSSYAAFARQSAMYLAHVAFSVSLSEVGRAFGRDRTTAAYACQIVEERRDDPAVEAVLASLECACGNLRRRLSAPVQS